MTTVTQYDIAWGDVYTAWSKSGLTYKAFWKGAFKGFLRNGDNPCYTSFVTHMGQEKQRLCGTSRAAKSETSSKETTAPDKSIVAVRKLDPGFFKNSVLRRSTDKPVTQIPQTAQSVKVTLPNGTLIEFATASPELFAVGFYRSVMEAA